MVERLLRPASARVAPIARRARASVARRGPDAFTIAGGGGLAVAGWMLVDWLGVAIASTWLLVLGVMLDGDTPQPLRVEGDE